MRPYIALRPGLSALFALSLFACSGDKDDPGSEESDADTDADSDADTDADSDADSDADADADYTIDITSPNNGGTVGPIVDVAWNVTGITLDSAAIGGANEADHGHVHVYVDDVYIDATGEAGYTLTDITEGAHTIKAVLASNDHTEYSISDSVSVTSGPPTLPVVAITSPAFGTTLSGSSVELGLLIQNFIFSEDIGGENEVSHGHYHVIVDGNYFDLSTDPDSAWVTRLNPGPHDITVELVNNDHTSLTPAASDTIEVTVAEGAPYVEIQEPINDTSIDSCSWPLAVGVERFTLSPEHFGGTAVPGEGHYHYYVDGVYTGATAESSTWLLQQNSGDHLITVILTDNDHTEIEALDYVRVSSPSDRPCVTLSSPPEGETVGSSFFVSVSTSNFTLDPSAVGGSDVADFGHYHVFIDGSYYGYSADTSTEVTGISAGEHVISVELVNNSHTSLTQPVIDSSTINVVP
jgi:hypothetical protein